MKKTKIQAMIDFLEDQIKKSNDLVEFVTIKEYTNSTQWVCEELLKKAIEIQDNDDLD